MRIYDKRISDLINSWGKFDTNPVDPTDFGSLREFSKRCPDPMKNVVAQLPNGLWVVKPDDRGLDITWAMVAAYDEAAAAIGFNFGFVEKPKVEPPPPPPDEPFEVNMMEALVGWRAWYVGASEICSMNSGTFWHIDQALESECLSQLHLKSKPVVHERCSCGIYAVDQRDEIPYNESPEFVIGQVYGWGRYVRGVAGWRAQFAYPKAFHLRQSQVTPEMMSTLRGYHVPIYVKTDVKFYSPEEDGYGYGETDQNGDRGAVDGAGAQEDRGSSGGSGEDSDEDAVKRFQNSS